MASVFGKILLITGNAEFLSARTRQRAIKSVLAEQSDCEVAESGAAGLAPGELAGLMSASLFSASTTVVLDDIQDLPDAAQAELLEFAADPSPDIAIILVHSGGQKGKGLLDKLRAQSAVTEIKHDPPKYERDYVAWLRTEFRDLGASIGEEAASVLVASVGQDLRALAGAADQLVAIRDETTEVTTEVVRRYFGGRVDIRGFDIADATIDGRITLALEQARWAEASKVAPVLITSAFASGLRSLARLSSAPPGMRDNDLAGHIGAPPFKIRTLKQQLRGWEPAGLAQALQAVAATDLDVKGGGTDPAYAIERLVLRVASLRRR